MRACSRFTRILSYGIIFSGLVTMGIVATHALNIPSPLKPKETMTASTHAQEQLSPSFKPSFPLSPSFPTHDGMPSLAPIIEPIVDAVVDITVSGTKVTRQAIPEPFQFFFGPGFPNQPQQQPFRALGSGVIVDDEKGYIVTNAHVVDGADEITVGLRDGYSFKVTKVGVDTQSDFALLQIKKEDLEQMRKNGRHLKKMVFSDSDRLAVGDFTIAIGNPFGLGQTVTTGIISALGRSGLDQNKLENFIQTDAAINQGNSGGALINFKGELVGINTAILGPSGNIGIGFAIPSNMIKNLMEQIIKFGEVRRGLLGIIGSELTQELAKTFGYNRQRGAFVQQVTQGSAADKAGIKSGDIIISLDSKEINSFSELRAKIGTMGAGKQVVIGLVRDGKNMNVTVTLDQAQYEGASADNLHPALEGSRLGNAPKDAPVAGVLVSEVKERSPAAALGLEQGDIIIGVNRKRVTDLADFRGILEAQDKNTLLALHIRRGDSTIYLVAH